MAITDYAALHGSGTGGYTGNPNQEYLNRTAVKTFEETLLFAEFCKSPEIVNGYATHSFFRTAKITSNPTDVTKATSYPSDTDVNIATVSVTPTEYLYKATINHNVERFNVMGVLRETGTALSNAMGRYADSLVQIEMTRLLSVASPVAANVTRNGRFTVKTGQTAVTNINGYTSSNIRNLTVTDIAKAAALLRSRSVDEFGDMGIVCIMAHEVAFDIQTSVSTSSVSWSTFTQHTPAGVMRIFRGFIGKVFGVTVYQNAHVQTFASTGTGTPTVYPTFFMSMNTIGCLKWNLNTFYIPSTPTPSNPSGLFAYVSVCLTFATITLQPDGFVVYFSGASTI